MTPKALLQTSFKLSEQVLHKSNSSETYFLWPKVLKQTKSHAYMQNIQNPWLEGKSAENELRKFAVLPATPTFLSPPEISVYFIWTPELWSFQNTLDGENNTDLWYNICYGIGQIATLILLKKLYFLKKMWRRVI